MWKKKCFFSIEGGADKIWMENSITFNFLTISEIYLCATPIIISLGMFSNCIILRLLPAMAMFVCSASQHVEHSLSGSHSQGQASSWEG